MTVVRRQSRLAVCDSRESTRRLAQLVVCPTVTKLWKYITMELAERLAPAFLSRRARMGLSLPCEL